MGIGGQTSAAAKTAEKGGALSGAVAVAEGGLDVSTDDKGLAVELTATGTKYYKDDSLKLRIWPRLWIRVHRRLCRTWPGSANRRIVVDISCGVEKVTGIGR